jgi:hypothetical protein
MKYKMLQLLLLFLVTGLFVSSKGTADKSKIKCELQYIHCATEKSSTRQQEKTGNPFALAPGSYIFYY